MDGFFKDLTHSLRMFRRSPGFTFAAVAALALGIGANTAIFSVVNAVLLKPVPFPDPDRLVMFMNTSPQGSNPGASPAKFAHWQAQTSVIESAAAFRNGVVNFTGGEIPEQLRFAQVSADFFRAFGAPIVLGPRLLGRGRSTERRQGGGHQPWTVDPPLRRRSGGHRQDHLAERRSLRRHRRGRARRSTSGVRSRRRKSGRRFSSIPNTTDQGHFFQAAARLKPGVTLRQAKARLQVSANEFRTQVSRRRCTPNQASA